MDLRKVAGSSRLKKLEAIHYRAANLLLTKPVGLVAKELEVNGSTLSAWKRSPLFQKHYEKIRVEAVSQGLEGAMDQAKMLAARACRKKPSKEPRKPFERDPSRRARELVKGKIRRGLNANRLQKIIDNGRCELTGISFDMMSYGWKMPSLDRIRPGEAYSDDNVRVVLYGVNTMMNQWGIEPVLCVADAYRAKQAKETALQVYEYEPLGV